MIGIRAARVMLATGCAVVAQVAVASTNAGGSGIETAGADAADPGSSHGEDIVVTGQKAETEASAGTKTNTPLIETPQSISVITNADIANLGQQNLNEALRFVAGVTPEQRGASAEVYDQFKLRGFDAPVYLDGLKLFSSASGYAVPQIDVSRLDRIEVIKGPASVLYGQSSPGGLVAEASKLPIDRDFYGAIAGTYGNYDLYRVDADIGGRISDMALWRLYGSVNGADDQQRYGKRRRETVSGAVTLGSGTPTTFTVLAAYSHDPRNGNYGVFPALGTFLDNPAGRIPTSFYGGEPNDFFKRDQFGITYIFKHDFGDSWSFRTLGRYQYIKSRLGIVYTSGLPLDLTETAPTVYARASYSTREQNNGWTYDNQLTGRVETGPVTHNLLFGADRQVAHSNEDYAFGSGTPIDVFNPVYGTMPTPRTPEEVPGFGAFPAFGGAINTHQRQQGLYAQDQIALAGLRITLSGRKDWARSASAGVVQHDDKFTYRTAALYKFDFGLAPYVSYSTSFEPQGGTISDPVTGVPIGAARPSTGRQVEAGAKYQVPGTEILLTASWFRIIQSNLLFAGPIPNTTVQGGKVRSRGVEVEASAPLPLGFNGKLAFSHQRLKAIDNTNPTALLGTGRGGISANLEWSPEGGPLKGLVVGGAVRHVNAVNAGSYLGAAPDRTPSYTLWDALARYDLGPMTGVEGLSVAVNAKNIFNKRYLTSCYLDYGWCWYGNRRTVQGTIAFKF